MSKTKWLSAVTALAVAAPMLTPAYGEEAGAVEEEIVVTGSRIGRDPGSFAGPVTVTMRLYAGCL